MSLDVYLTEPRTEETPRQKAVKLLRANGFDRDANELEWRDDPDAAETYYSANITHNLNTMAQEAGIYETLWRPEEIGITKAAQLIEPLSNGLKLMLSDRARFEKFNAANGWGKYEHFVPFVRDYLSACNEYPDAEVSASR